MKRLKLLAMASMLVMITFALTLTVYASGGIEVTPLLPGNQRAETTTFFDLNVQPGQEQELAIRITNSNAFEVSVTVEASIASTNRSGQIVYVSPEDVGYPPRRLLTDMVQLPADQITIPPESRYDYIFTLTVPDEEFDGIIQGSVRAIRELTEEEAAVGGLVARYSHNTPIRLRQNDDPIELKQDDIILESVRPELVRLSVSAVCSIINTMPIRIRDAVITAQVDMVGSDEPFIEYFNDSIQIAPESMFPLAIVDDQGKTFEAGEYIVKINMQYDGMEWNFEEGFEITQEEADEFNERVWVDEEETEDFPWAIVLIIAGAALMWAIVIALILIKRSRDKKEEMLEEENASNNEEDTSSITESGLED